MDERSRSEGEEREKAEDQKVSYVEIGAIPEMVWECPSCKTVQRTQARELIEPVGNFGQIEWQCDCGHKGRLARARSRLPGQQRTERRRLEREARKQRNRG